MTKEVEEQWEMSNLLRWIKHLMLKQLGYLLVGSKLEQAKKNVTHENRIVCSGRLVPTVACL